MILSTFFDVKRLATSDLNYKKNYKIGLLKAISMEKICEECQRFYQYFVREKKKTSEIRLKLAKKIQEKNVKLRFNDCFFLTKKKKD